MKILFQIVTNVKLVFAQLSNSMKNKYYEVEIKYKADHIDWNSFVKTIRRDEDSLIEEVKVTGPDQYYRLGVSIVRYRHNFGGFHELTVKTRTSSKTTIVREEIDLNLINHTDPKDVEKFLVTSGYKREFTIVKKCHIFKLTCQAGLGSIVIYDIYRLGESKKRQRFVEIEGDKNQSIQVNKKWLSYWEKKLEKVNLNKKDIYNLSLYEIFSNKMYRVKK